MESLKINGHTLEYIKGQAKKYKKKQNVKHSEALNAVAKYFGFENYKDCLTQFKK